MILREMLAILEGRNHLGEQEQTTWSGWRAACKKVNPDVWFEGDKDIAQAMVGPKPYKHGETKSIGEWDGEKGCVYSHAKAVKEAIGLSEGVEEGLKKKYRFTNDKGYEVVQVKSGEDFPYRIKEVDGKFALTQGNQERKYLPMKWVSRGKFDSREAALKAIAKRHNKDDAHMNWGKIEEAKNGPKERHEKFEPGFYVVDEDDVPIHGPFTSERKAGLECDKLGGQKRGYTVDFIEKIEEATRKQSAFAILNKLAKSEYGEFGFATLSDDQASKFVDMKKADKLADEMEGEFGLMSCDEGAMRRIVNKHPELLKGKAAKAYKAQLNENDEGSNSAYEAWQDEVRKTYSDVADKIKFKSNPKGDVEAVIRGVDRIYGIFDVEKDEGMVLKD